MDAKTHAPAGPVTAFVSRNYDLIMLACIFLMVLSGTIGGNLLILRLSLVLSFNMFILGIFPRNSWERTSDERVVALRHQAGFWSFIVAIAGLAILVGALSFVNGITTDLVFRAAWHFIAISMLIYCAIYSTLKRLR